MISSTYLPILELTRGSIIESIHFGAFAIVDSHNNLLAAHGDPKATSFLRSAAKPFQALPLIESGGHRHWELSKKEIAIICASHGGTDDHAETVLGIQKKINVDDEYLLCGTHPPLDPETSFTLRAQGIDPTPKRHNCSGKHTGMLALAQLMDVPMADYINPEHPIQKEIKQTFSRMCGIDPEAVSMGTDGCSAPNFAIPLENAALGFARLCDPHDLPAKRAEACRTITNAMTTYPDMVAGPGRFDTHLMEAAEGKVVAKVGAEGYFCIGIMPGAINDDSPGIGIAIKITDGDLKNRARPAAILDILRQLGVLNQAQLDKLSSFGPKYILKNWRQLIVGELRSVIELK
ncbi:MAG: asparaginase [Anaerolineales bacterium]|nr:asparaginase [Chloroflexota bacterium]MBL6980243.1 asparaginase [Anaerolineales bacterium]